MRTIILNNAQKKEVEAAKARLSALKQDLEKISNKIPMKNKLSLKNGVKINGAHFNPEIVRILDIARQTAPTLSDQTVWITSANDSKHMENSKHYSNEAFDIRVRNVIKQHPAVERWCARMRLQLGKNYDVLYGDPAHRDHIHVEFDPK